MVIDTQFRLRVDTVWFFKQPQAPPQGGSSLALALSLANRKCSRRAQEVNFS